jgi:hypothetical protein
MIGLAVMPADSYEIECVRSGFRSIGLLSGKGGELLAKREGEVV